MGGEIALFSRLIDYAGMFPPAGLSPDEAVDNYAGYARSHDAWLLGRLVVPALRLQETAEVLAQRTLPSGAGLSVVLRLPDARADYFEGLRSELTFFDRYTESASPLPTIEAVEMTLPARAVPEDGDGRATFLRRVRSAIEASHPTLEMLFLEVPLSEQRAAHIDALLREMAALNSKPGTKVGAKIRCAGATEDDVPSVAALGRALHAFIRYRLPWKATAGLHHAFSTQDHRGRGNHGFVNLFAAAALAFTKRLAVPEIEAILAEPSGNSFVIDPGTLSWRGVRVSDSEIRTARSQFALGFGSCSFEEPRDELRSIGLLQPADA